MKSIFDSLLPIQGRKIYVLSQPLHVCKSGLDLFGGFWYIGLHGTYDNYEKYQNLLEKQQKNTSNQ